MSMTDELNAVRDSINSGAIADLPAKRLEEFSVILCRAQAFSHFGASQFPQICETVRTHLVRAHIETLQSHVTELHDHITKLNASNAKIQKWVIALAVAALIAAVVQTTVAIRTEQREEAKTKQGMPLPQGSTQPLEAQAQEVHQSSGQAKRKSP